MSTRANVSSGVLKALADGLQTCASSVARLRGAVRAHIDESLGAAKVIVMRLREVEAAANMRYERASAAYHSCRRRQKYDEESREYRPSCACEERDMKRAADALYKARHAREQAEMRLCDMEREVGSYRQPSGGEGIMDAITDAYVPDATARLSVLADKVSRYEGLVIAGIDIGDASSGTPALGSPQSKAAGFGRGMERIREKMDRRAALFGNYCPKCKCCPCECDRIRELLMSNSR